MRHLTILTVLILLAAVAGCGRNDTTNGPQQAKQPITGIKQKASEAGSCKKHGVQEALCTKCNPKLAAVFQAKGDWCAAHGFPKSICPVCHPERRGKPTVEVAIDEAPADGTKVILKGKETARLAGIETVLALPGQGRTEIIAPVVITYDTGRVAQVGARAPGVVTRVMADIGLRVTANSPLAVIESATVRSDQARLAAARSRVQIAEAAYFREAKLEQKGISSQREVQAAQQNLREATAECESLQASLRGVEADGENGGRYTLKAPVSGVITQRLVTLNQYVDTRTPLFEIVDTSSLWAEIALPERELGRLKVGSKVIITLEGLEGRKFASNIAHIAPLIDTQTRTVKVRVRLANPGGLLRVNMYGRAHFPVRGYPPSTSVPQDAVQRIKTAKIVFVRLAPNEYETRRVELRSGRGAGDMVELASGVEIGEEVVVAGSFLLKTETLKDSIGAGCCEIDTKKE